MALSTVSGLRTAIADWLDRTDITTDTINDFIALSEARFNREVRDLEMETRSTATLSGEYLAIPDDFLGLRSLHIEASPDISLEYISPQEMDSRNFPSTGGPCFYTVVDNQFRFAPVPGSSHTIEIIYFQKIPALTDSNTTNWLLTEHPDAYLFGALVEAEAYVVNDQRVPGWESRLQIALDRIRLDGKRKRHGGGPLKIRTSVRERV